MHLLICTDLLMRKGLSSSIGLVGMICPVSYCGSGFLLLEVVQIPKALGCVYTCATTRQVSIAVCCVSSCIRDLEHYVMEPLII